MTSFLAMHCHSDLVELMVEQMKNIDETDEKYEKYCTSNILVYGVNSVNIVLNC